MPEIRAGQVGGIGIAAGAGRLPDHGDAGLVRAAAVLDEQLDHPIGRGRA